MQGKSQRHLDQEAWEKWVRTPIFATAGIYAVGPRYAVLHEFVQRGLFPFVTGKGYVFAKDVKGITMSLLRYLFALWQGKHVKFYDPHKGCQPEHGLEFEHRFDTLVLDEFWDQWGGIQDFESDSYGYPLRYTLPFFVWANLDLNRSSIYAEVETALHDLEEYEESIYGKRNPRERDDPYLQDTSKVNYEDRHWH